MSDPATPRPVVSPLGGGRYLVDTGGRTRVAHGARSGDAVWVFLDGQVFVVGGDRGPGGAGAARLDERSSLSAPMPATVVAIDVRPGQPVRRGDVLIRLEAMKMELPIRAPRDATVVSVACREGQLVQPGVALLELH